MRLLFLLSALTLYAQTIEFETRQDSRLTVRTTLVLTRDGRRLEHVRLYNPGGEIEHTSRNIWFADHRYARLDDSTRTITKLVTLTLFHAPQRDWRSRCNAEAAQSTSTWLSQPVLVFQTERPGLRSTTWVAPDLQCTELRHFNEYLSETGKVESTTDHRATSINRGHIPNTLFQLPQNYTQVSPSEQYLRESTFRHLHPDPILLESFRLLDRLQTRHPWPQ